VIGALVSSLSCPQICVIYCHVALTFLRQIKNDWLVEKRIEVRIIIIIIIVPLIWLRHPLNLTNM